VNGGPINIHIVPKPGCTCTTCSRPAGTTGEIELTIEPGVEQFNELAQRLGAHLGTTIGAAMMGLAPYVEAMRSATAELAKRWDVPPELLMPRAADPDFVLPQLGQALADPAASDGETPQERALRLRRARNTGPQPRRRAPRRIDARRAR
jgi:hypothetical protein